MKAISPAWKQALSSTEDWNAYRRELIIGLLENRISTAMQIEQGLSAARANPSPWLPSIGQFVAWCKGDPSQFGLPSAEQAYLDAAHKRWSAHPIVYRAAVAVGVYEVATRPEKQIKPAFIAAYEALAARVMAGEKFEGEPAGRGIEARRERLEQKPVTPEESDAARLQALKLLGVRR